MTHLISCSAIQDAYWLPWGKGFQPGCICTNDPLTAAPGCSTAAGNTDACRYKQQCMDYLSDRRIQSELEIHGVDSLSKLC